MPKPKFTPKPWRAVEHDTLKQCYTLKSDETYSDGFQKTVAYVTGVSPEDIALIVEAPALYEALRAYVEQEEQAAPYSSSLMRENARSILVRLGDSGL